MSKEAKHLDYNNSNTQQKILDSGPIDKLEEKGIHGYFRLFVRIASLHLNMQHMHRNHHLYINKPSKIGIKTYIDSKSSFLMSTDIFRLIPMTFCVRVFFCFFALGFIIIIFFYFCFFVCFFVCLFLFVLFCFVFACLQYTLQKTNEFAKNILHTNIMYQKLWLM